MRLTRALPAAKIPASSCKGYLFPGPYDIRTVQELPGHKDVTTTMIYTHVRQKPGLGVKSPLDSLRGMNQQACSSHFGSRMTGVMFFFFRLAFIQSPVFLRMAGNGLCGYGVLIFGEICCESAVGQYPTVVISLGERENRRQPKGSYRSALGIGITFEQFGFGSRKQLLDYLHFDARRLGQPRSETWASFQYVSKMHGEAQEWGSGGTEFSRPGGTYELSAADPGLKRRVMVKRRSATPHVCPPVQLEPAWIGERHVVDGNKPVIDWGEASRIKLLSRRPSRHRDVCQGRVSRL